jgi:hypothetical protein
MLGLVKGNKVVGGKNEELRNTGLLFSAPHNEVLPLVGANVRS